MTLLVSAWTGTTWLDVITDTVNDIAINCRETIVPRSDQHHQYNRKRVRADESFSLQCVSLEDSYAKLIVIYICYGTVCAFIVCVQFVLLVPSWRFFFKCKIPICWRLYIFISVYSYWLSHSYCQFLGVEVEKDLCCRFWSLVTKVKPGGRSCVDLCIWLIPSMMCCIFPS